MSDRREPARWFGAQGGAPRALRDLPFEASAPRPLSAVKKIALEARLEETLPASRRAASFWQKAARMAPLTVVGLGLLALLGRSRLASERSAETAESAEIAEAAEIAPIAPSPAAPLEPPARPPLLALNVTELPDAPVMAERREARATPAPIADVAPPPESAAPAATTTEPSGTSRAAPEDPLARELALLDDAKRILSADPARALRIADAHRAAFPAGQLAAERELVAIAALVRLGRRGDAERRASELLRVQPNGPHAERARTILSR